MKAPMIVVVVISLLFIFSCNTPRYIYGVTPQNLPVLKKKGDYQAGAFYSTHAEQTGVLDSPQYSRGVDAQAAFAISDHWALTGSLGYRWEKEFYDDNYTGTVLQSQSFVRYYLMNWEVGGGYFSSIHRRDKIYLQFFGGIGGGRYSIDDNGWVYDYTSTNPVMVPFDRFHDSKVFRFYLHPAVHFHFNRYFIMSVGAKFTNVHYSDVITDYTTLEQENYRLLITGKTFSFFEPAVDFKFRIPGAEWIAPNMQLTFSTYLQNYATRTFNASFGISIMRPVDVKSER